MSESQKKKYEGLQRLGTQARNKFLSAGESVKKEKKTVTQKLLDNWKSGLTVGLVNMPLCISLAIASGCSPECGVLSGIWAGLCTGFYGGSNFNIVGPTGALSGFLMICVARYGTESIPYFAFLTGIIPSI